MSPCDPWRRLQEQPHVRLVSHEGGAMGWADHVRQTVSLRAGMTWAERRCTLLHELLHLDRGPQPPGLRAKDEEAVRRQTARELLPDVRAIGEALAWAPCLSEAAEELGVDVFVLRKRLRHLGTSERSYLSRRLDGSGS
ncbi:hypothetical protein [Nocardioides terrae]|nr:hypothetical protein [Nocardioides terrae]